jgi:tetratricopeptide (TPR) repeat protein
MRTLPTRTYHASHEEIASFIAGSIGEIDRARVRVHLECCEGCREAYRYAVRYRGMHNGVPADDAPSIQALRAAKAIAERDYLRTNANRRGTRRWVAGLGPAGRAVLTAAVVVVFVLAVVWLRPISMDGDFDLHSEALFPITDAMVTASQRNPLVLPGVQQELGVVPATLRSGPVTVTRRLDNSLSRLALAYNAGSLSGDEAQWLIGGYVATGQIANARIFIEDARERYPEDTDLVVLEGILAYGADDLERAAALFESVLEEDEGDAVAAFNLAVVKEEAGETSDARDWFERVRDLASGSPLAARAEAALTGIQ